MIEVHWSRQTKFDGLFRWAWAGGNAGPRSEHRRGTSADMAIAFAQALPKAWAKGQDLFVLPMNWIDQGYGALVSDMDSTLIVGESLDDLAATLGVGDQVAQITARSMRGELDFAQALDMRFQLIKGVHRDAFTSLGHQTPVSPGAADCIAALVGAGVHCTLATGGFDVVAAPVVERLGMQDFVANTLAFDDQGLFLGTLAGPVLDADAKRRTLLSRQQQSGGRPCLAMGDGANDLAMIAAAKVGIAYRAKPIVREATCYQLNHVDLASLPYLLGVESDVNR